MSSLHNALDYGPEIGRSLGRFTGLGPLEEGTIRLGETLTPVVDAFALPELSFLRNETLCAYSRFQAAVVAELCGVALVNPATSGLLVIVEGISSITAAGDIHQVYMHLDSDIIGTLDSSSTGSRRDRRGTGAPTVSRAVVRYGTDAAVSTGSILEQRRDNAAATAGMLTFQAPPIVLNPGVAVAVWNAATNTQVYVNFKWRERLARPGENP